MSKAHRFPIGYKYVPRNKKSNHVITITDQLTTYNSAGEVVKATYLGEHEFLGQKVTDYDILDTSISMGTPA